MKNFFALIFTVIGLVACGGGGGSSSSPVAVTPPTTPTNPTTPVDPTPPVVTPPTVATCAAPAVAGPQVMYDKVAMLNVCDGVYVEPTATAAEQLSLRQTVAAAYTTVTAFYGSFTAAHPRMVFCQTQTCRTYFMGTYAAVYAPAGYQLPGSSYYAGTPTLFVTYSSFPNLAHDTTAHELSHVEFEFRVGGGGFPAWFNEGVATLVGKYPDCTDKTTNLIADLRTLDSGTALAAATADSSRGDVIYCQASREASAWIAANGKQKYLDLLAGVKSGQQFYSIYGNLVVH